MHICSSNGVIFMNAVQVYATVREGNLALKSGTSSVCRTSERKRLVHRSLTNAVEVRFMKSDSQLSFLLQFQGLVVTCLDFMIIKIMLNKS